MLKFIKSSVPGLLAVALVAVAGYVALHLPAGASEQPSAAEIRHARYCNFCSVSYYGLPGQPSSHGPDPNAVKDTPASPSLTAR
jgi:hypothetical protein